MGELLSTLSRAVDRYKHPDEWPNPWGYQGFPQFDPHYGFPYKRKPREWDTTWEECRKWGLKIEDMDYCASILIRFNKCRLSHAPFANYYCHDIRHEYEDCQLRDYLLREKEFERQRRLILREKRKRLKREAEEREAKFQEIMAS